MVKGLDMGRRRLLEATRRGVLSSLTFTDNDYDRYLNQAWLREATDIVGGQER